MSSAVLSHSPSGLLTWVPHHFLSDPSPRNDQCAYFVTLWAFAIHVFVSSFCPSTVIAHWHQDDPSLGVLKFTLQFSHHLLNLVEDLQCGESWENCPLELHRLPVDSIQIFEIASFQIPFDPAFPGFDWFCNASQTQHWVGKDVGFGSRKLDSSVSWISSFFPHRLLPVNRGRSSNFCLIPDQLLSFETPVSQISRVDSW